MNKTVSNLIAVFLWVALIDVMIGPVLMPFDLGMVIWPLINFPVLIVFPFQYLGVCTFVESLYLWPLHAGIIGSALYLAVIAIKWLVRDNVPKPTQ